jgi:hypothetical protein
VCRSKHVEQLKNTGIINSTTRSHLVGYFCKMYKFICSSSSKVTPVGHIKMTDNFCLIYLRQEYTSRVNTAHPSTCTTTCCLPGPISGQRDFKQYRSLHDVYKGWCKHTLLFPLQKPAVLIEALVWVTARNSKTVTTENFVPRCNGATNLELCPCGCKHLLQDT